MTTYYDVIYLKETLNGFIIDPIPMLCRVDYQTALEKKKISWIMCTILIILLYGKMWKTLLSNEIRRNACTCKLCFQTW